MKVDEKDLLLYAVTDRAWTGEKSLYEQVEEALIGGATFLQLREKELDEDSFLKEAIEIKELCQKYRVPFVINDNVEIASRVNADGVHVGQSDMQADDVRKIIGENKILGVSAQTVEQAIIAEKRGADYIGVGSIFQTVTKADAEHVSLETLKQICNSVNVPVVAIGGIGIDNISMLKDTGICGVAVIGAIFREKDISLATSRLRRLAEDLQNEPEIDDDFLR